MRRSPALPTDVIAGAEAQHDGRHVVAGIAVRDVAASVPTYRTCGSAISSEVSRRMGSLAARRSEPMISCWVVMAPMTMSPPSSWMPLRSPMPARSTRWSGRREPELHHGDQAVPAGERPCLVAEIGKQGHGFAHATSDDGSRRNQGSRAYLPGARPRRPTRRRFLHCAFWREAARACAAATTAAAPDGRRMHEKPQSARNASAMLMQSASGRAASPQDRRASDLRCESVYDATASSFDPIRALNQLTRLRATGTE